ncbi:MAG: GatB/YqeY domain-containing protein [bacterium]|nr:GatB/YqeY domain-containing protein [bacterium]
MSTVVTKEKLTEDLKMALKNADQNTVGVLRFLIAAINNKEIEKRGKTDNTAVTSEELMRVIMTEEKKRKDAITIFEKGGRQDLADKEKIELEIIRKYLPQQLSPDDIKKEIEKILSQHAGSDFGGAMKVVMEKLRGKADARLVSEIVKEMTG